MRVILKIGEYGLAFPEGMSLSGAQLETLGEAEVVSVYSYGSSDTIVTVRPERNVEVLIVPARAMKYPESAEKEGGAQ